MFVLWGCEEENDYVTSNNYGETVTDIDGNEYLTVVIFNQTWIAENLKTTKLNDGSPIIKSSVSDTLADNTLPHYSIYDNETDNKNHYGVLYNWYAINTQKLCPTGWKVPSEEDWEMLTDSLGGTSIAGGKLKQNGTAYWKSANVNATNSYNFNALPGGYRNLKGTFKHLGERGFWWSSTSRDSVSSWYQALYYYSGQIYNNNFSNNMGFSVRCVKTEKTKIGH